MKIVFMGTPKFAIPSLQKLIDAGHTIQAVVSQPDKPRGRGKEISYTPVKEFAIKNKLKVYTPLKLSDPDFIEEIKKLVTDLIVVVAFRILPKELYTLATKGAINLHASLLPKYRGAAPIQWAIINGEKETGLTTFFLEDKVDTGNIILQEKIDINEEDTFGSLHDKMMNRGADLLLKTVSLIESGNVKPIKQANELASPAPKITKEICLIDWSKSAIEINNLVRGLSPYPGAIFIFNGKNYKVFKTCVVKEDLKIGAETILNSVDTNSKSIIIKAFITKKEFFVETGDGILQILDILPEGRKRMSIEEFLRGYSL